MSYLICEKCGGYYQLQEDESPQDFETCPCGGKLKYDPQFHPPETSASESQDDLGICPECGGENLLETTECEFCGQKLDVPPESVKKDMDLNFFIMIAIIILTVNLFAALGMIYFLGQINAVISILVSVITGAIIGINIKKGIIP